jgi:hypothetical protein
MSKNKMGREMERKREGGDNLDTRNPLIKSTTDNQVFAAIRIQTADP